MSTRLCNKCKQEKPLKEFNATPQISSTGKTYIPRRKTCNECKGGRSMERLIERFGYKGMRLYNDKRRFMRRYGITYETAETMLQSQNGLCGICQLPIQFFTKTYDNRACIDHCHSTNKVRGVLCQYCNSGIGYLKDSPTILAQAAIYLKDN